MSLTKEDCEYLYNILCELASEEITMTDSLSDLIDSPTFQRLQNRVDKQATDIDYRSREEKLEDKNYILCKRCDLVLAKKHISRHEKTPRCLETYKKKIASKKAQCTIVNQKDLINLDNKDRDDIIENYYEKDEKMSKLIEMETNRIALTGEK